MDPKSARRELLAHALKNEGAWVDHPWDEDVVKVGKKIFVFFGRRGPELGLGVKLPRSLLFARAQKFVERFGYGMDKAGWVAARFPPGSAIPMDTLRAWIDESYDAIAAVALPKGRKRTTAPVAAKSRTKKTTSKPSLRKPKRGTRAGR